MFSRSRGFAKVAMAVAPLMGAAIAYCKVPENPQLDNFLLLSGRNSRVLADEIAFHLKTKVGALESSTFADGEVSINIRDQINNKDIYILHSAKPPVNDSLMELFLLTSCCARAGAKSINLVIPVAPSNLIVAMFMTYKIALIQPHICSSSILQYFAYKRDTGAQSSLNHIVTSASTAEDNTSEHTLLDDSIAQVPISAADVAKLCEESGATRVVTLELQPPGQGQIEGFFHVPVDNIRTTKLAIDYLSRLNLKNPVIVAPNEWCMMLAEDFQAGLSNKLQTDIGVAAVLSRSADPTPKDLNVGEGSSPDTPRAAKESLELVGDVNGRDVVIVDDLIDTGKGLYKKAKLLKSKGAKKIVAFATHGLFNGSAMQRISHSNISEVIVTDSLPLSDNVRPSSKITQLPVAPLLADAIYRTHNNLSMHDLRVYSTSNKPIPRYLGQE